jgi:DNA-directed RNA polymerase specialized sigma24 family protein
MPTDTPQLELAVTINDMLQQLRFHDSDACTLVELKFFLGLTDQEAADVLDVPLRTLQRRWLETREWLHERIVC